MKNEKETIISVSIQALLVIFVTILIIQLFLKLTGHSPTETQIIYSIFIALTIYLFSISYKLGGISENQKLTNIRLLRIEERLIGIEGRLNKIEDKL